MSGSSSIPFRSKKPLVNSPVSKPPPGIGNPNLIAPDTPQEKIQSRTRNRGIALSVKEIRQAAQTRRHQDNDPTDEIKSSARKQILSSPRKQKNTEKSCERLPEKYEKLGEFFDALDSAIRLSKLKRSMPTFTNISSKIECLTDRRFSYSHLAQMKYILPEVIEIKRVLNFDERTSCMKPDLHVTLNADAVEYDKKLTSESKNMSLRRVFRARLSDFIKAHPEGNEIPEEPLPEPFNHSKHNLQPNVSEASTSAMPVEAIEEQKPAVASHLSRLSQKRFKISSSEKTISASALAQNKLSLKSPPKEKCLSYCSSPAKPVSFCQLATAVRASSPLEIASTPSKHTSTLFNVTSTPSEVFSTPRKVASTPPQLASTPARLMSATPAPQAPKRSFISPDGNSVSSPNKLIRRPKLPPKMLKFEPQVEEESAEEGTNKKVEDEVQEMEGSSSYDDILGILPESLLQSIRDKEKKAMEDQDPAISRAKRRRKMIGCLPKLFNIIHFLFQSVRRSVITKEELVHKIIAGHSDIVDRREVEEQLSLMLELVPEWISEKNSSSGDLLIYVNKMSAPESIRARLEEESRQGTSSGFLRL